jgi:hypothetical protein
MTEREDAGIDELDEFVAPTPLPIDRPGGWIGRLIIIFFG